LTFSRNELNHPWLLPSQMQFWRTGPHFELKLLFLLPWTLYSYCQWRTQSQNPWVHSEWPNSSDDARYLGGLAPVLWSLSWWWTFPGSVFHLRNLDSWLWWSWFLTHVQHWNTSILQEENISLGDCSRTVPVDFGWWWHSARFYWICTSQEDLQELLVQFHKGFHLWCHWTTIILDILGKRPSKKSSIHQQSVFPGPSSGQPDGFCWEI